MRDRDRSAGPRSTCTQFRAASGAKSEASGQTDIQSIILQKWKKNRRRSRISKEVQHPNRKTESQSIRASKSEPAPFLLQFTREAGADSWSGWQQHFPQSSAEQHEQRHGKLYHAGFAGEAFKLIPLPTNAALCVPHPRVGPNPHRRRDVTQSKWDLLMWRGVSTLHASVPVAMKTSDAAILAGSLL